MPQLSHAQFPLRRHPIPSSFIDGSRTASVGDPRGADGEGRDPPQVAGFKSERWPASNRNGGRHEIGIGGRIESEFAGWIPPDL